MTASSFVSSANLSYRCHGSPLSMAVRKDIPTPRSDLTRERARLFDISTLVLPHPEYTGITVSFRESVQLTKHPCLRVQPLCPSYSSFSAIFCLFHATFGQPLCLSIFHWSPCHSTCNANPYELVASFKQNGVAPKRSVKHQSTPPCDGLLLSR